MTVSNMPHRSFLDVKEVETIADLGALRDALSEAARDAEKLGLADVKEHLDMALDALEKAGIRSNA